MMIRGAVIIATGQKCFASDVDPPKPGLWCTSVSFEMSWYSKKTDVYAAL